MGEGQGEGDKRDIRPPPLNLLPPGEERLSETNAEMLEVNSQTCKNLTGLDSYPSGGPDLLLMQCPLLGAPVLYLRIPVFDVAPAGREGAFIGPGPLTTTVAAKIVLFLPIPLPVIPANHQLRGAAAADRAGRLLPSLSRSDTFQGRNQRKRMGHNPLAYHVKTYITLPSLCQIDSHIHRRATENAEGMFL